MVFLSNLCVVLKKIILGILHICLRLFFPHALILNKNTHLCMVTDYKKNLNGNQAATYFEYSSPRTLVRPCSTKKMFISELETNYYPLFFRGWIPTKRLSRKPDTFTGFASPYSDIDGVASSFKDLAMGETTAPACFLRENAEGAVMPPMLSF